jgi:putative NADPH-quinone reductase
MVNRSRGIIIQGSSRVDGNTSRVVSYLADMVQFDVVDLKTKQIGYFDYNHQNSNDDFLPLLRDIVSQYDVMVFATPVYWYTMSAEMKTFFDRISDALKIEKNTGRKLRGKYMAALSCGSDEDLNPGFFEPFELSAEYLGMHYLGHVHTWNDGRAVTNDVALKLRSFADQLGLSKWSTNETKEKPK